MRKIGRKNPALVELILVILFFSLSSMVLVQVFVKAKILSREGRDGTMGVLFAQDVIEQWKAGPSSPEEVFRAEEGWTEETSLEGTRVFVSSRDKNMNAALKTEEETDGSVMLYTARVELTEEPGEAGMLYRIRVTVTEERTDELRAELETTRYMPDFREEAGP